MREEFVISNVGVFTSDNVRQERKITVVLVPKK